MEKYKLSVLIVEDDKLSLFMYTEFLKTVVSEVYSASNGFDGIRIFRNNKPDIVITDIMMPEMDGLEMIKKIKDIDPGVKAIMISGHSDADYFIRSIDLGVDAYLLKPVDNQKLKRKIGDLGENIMLSNKVAEKERAEKILIKAKEKAEEVFSVMEKFAQYGFNRSHSAAYSVVAYQTAYLKAHYPGEYMSSVLTHNQSNIDKITFFLDESKRQGIKVLGPDVNESDFHFDVNEDEQIRFGLGAIKGSGESAVQAIIQERDEHGKFKDIFDFASREKIRTVNKKTFECLALAGAFDSFPDISRRQYVYENGEPSLIEKAIRYGNQFQLEKNASQHSLFGDAQGGSIPLPKPLDVEPFGEIEKLKIERDIVGFYISGHPLDQFRVELRHFCTCPVNKIEDYKNQFVKLGGVISKSIERYTKNGKPFGLFTLEDYEDSLDMALFGEDYLKNRHMLNVDTFVFLTGKVEERYNQPGVWEFRTKTIQLLNDVREQLAKEIRLSIPIDTINDYLVDHFENLTKSNPGKCKLKINLVDPEENLSTDLMSLKYMVDPSNELLTELDRMEELRYQILTSS